MNETVRDNVTGKRYVRVNKRVAKRTFDKGLAVMLIPSKCAFNGIWVNPCPIRKSDDESVTFDAHVNAYLYYNCNSYLGNYPHYYIEIT